MSDEWIAAFADGMFAQEWAGMRGGSTDGGEGVQGETTVSGEKKKKKGGRSKKSGAARRAGRHDEGQQGDGSGAAVALTGRAPTTGTEADPTSKADLLTRALVAES